MRLTRIKNATQEMRDELITPIEFLQKIANMDNKIMKASSEDDLVNVDFDNSIATNSESSDSEDEEDPSKCIICNINKREVLLLPCAHMCCCKICWAIQKSNLNSKGRAVCPILNCNSAVKKITFVDI